MKAIYESYNAKRPIGYVSVLVVGSSGVGKSSTVKFLFDINQRGDDDANIYRENDSNDQSDDNEDQNCDSVTIGTSASKSKTKSVTEYVLASNDSEFEVSDIKLGITDSPGSNDTAGHSQDACNMYAIKTFYDTHPRFMTPKKVFPNLVLLVISANDWRIRGDSSNLVISIKCLKELELIDFEKPNVIGIITHAASLGWTKDKWTKNFRKKCKMFKFVISKHLGLDINVIPIENDPIDQGFEPKNYGFLFPDQETMEPKNLFDACTDLLLTNDDTFGYLAFTATFKQENLSPELGHSVPAKCAEKEKLSKGETIFFEFWKKISEGKTIGDPVYDKAQSFCIEKGFEGAQKGKIETIAAKLNQFWNFQQFHSLTTNIVSQQTGIELNKDASEFLEYLGVRNVELINADNSVLLIGNGYNLLTNKTTTQRILKYQLRDSRHGVCIPEAATFDLINKTKQYMTEFSGFQDRVAYRLQNLGISFTVSENVFQSYGSWAYGGKQSSIESSSTNIHFFLKEHRVFKVTLIDLEKVDLTDAFKADVEHLPRAFSDNYRFFINRMINHSKYERFFQRWGHFMITEAYGGGNIEFSKNCKHQAVTSDADQNFFVGLYNYFTGDTESQWGSSSANDSANESMASLESCNLEWNGGDARLHRKATVFDPDKLNDWLLSLYQKPIMLETEMNLVPISDLVEKVDREKADACYEALKSVLGGEIEAEKRTKTNKGQKMEIEAQNRYEEVKNSRKQTGNDESCFPGDVWVIQCQSGIERKVLMQNIKLGALVKTFNAQTNRTVFSPVLLFAHYKPTEFARFRRIVLNDGNNLTISENHLIFSKKKGESRMAIDLVPGDVLFSGSAENPTGVKISRINDVFSKGYFCPITEEGTIIVNNIHCSCYASCKSFLGIDAHYFAHAWLYLMRLVGILKKKNADENNPRVPPIMHPYIKFLEKLSPPMPFRQ